AARAVAHVGTPGADARIGRNADLQIFHAHVGQGFTHAGTHAIPEGDVGEQQGIAHVFDGFGRFRRSFYVLDAYVVHKLGINAAQNLVIFFGVGTYYHPVGAARAVDGVALGQEFRVGRHAKVLHAVLVHDALHQAGRAHRHRA